MANHGEVAWMELNAHEPEKVKAFYATICGWEWTSMPIPGGEGDYHIAMKNGQMQFGMLDLKSVPGAENAPSAWLTYFEVDDVDKACEQAKEAGGQVAREPWDIPQTGRIAIVLDPGGAVFGLMKSLPMPQG